MLTQLRGGHEVDLLERVGAVLNSRVTEAKGRVAATEAAVEISKARRDFLVGRVRENDNESKQNNLLLAQMIMESIGAQGGANTEVYGVATATTLEHTGGGGIGEAMTFELTVTGPAASVSPSASEDAGGKTSDSNTKSAEKVAGVLMRILSLSLSMINRRLWSL